MTWQTVYQSEQGCISWYEHFVRESNAFNAFQQGQAAARLSDLVGHDAYALMDESISLRHMSASRRDAPHLAESLRFTREDTFPAICQRLEALPQQVWSEALDWEDVVFRKARMIMDGER